MRHLSSVLVRRQPADFWAVVYTRRSVRHYLPVSIPPPVVSRLIDAACRAPSAHNSQPWRFVVVSPGSLRQQLAGQMAARFAQDLAQAGMPLEQVARKTKRSQARIIGAPVLVVSCLAMEEMDPCSDPKQQALEIKMGEQSVAAAMMNFLLAAEAEGLAACWMCAPLFCPEVVVEVLNLPISWQPQAFITLGYAAKPPKSKTLAPLETRIVYR